MTTTHNFVNAQAASALLSTANNKMVTVTFIKKDGSVRQINGLLRTSPASHANSPDLVTLENIHPKAKKKFGSARIGSITRIATQKQVIEAKQP